MAVAAASPRTAWAEHALPYGAAALVTIAAIISAWPIYPTPSFPYLALALVVIGTPLSIYLRQIDINRRALNIGLVGASLIFIFSMLQRLPLPAAGGDIFRLALFIDDRAAMGFVIQVFITIAMFRSFSLLTDRDLTLSIVPAFSTILLAAVIERRAAVTIAMLWFLLGALYLLAFDHQEELAAQAAGPEGPHQAPRSPQGREGGPQGLAGAAAGLGARADRLLEPARRRSLLAAGSVRMWLVLVPVTLGATLLFGLVNLPRFMMMRYRHYLPSRLMVRIYEAAMPAWITPSTAFRLSGGRILRNVVLFRVDSREAALWRAATIDSYDGRGWQNAPPLAHRELLAERDHEWKAPTRDPGVSAGVPVTELKQTYHLDAPMQGTILTAYEPRTLSGDFVRPRLSASSVLTCSNPQRSGTMYTVTSRRKAAPGARSHRAAARLSPAESRRYLALPHIPVRTRRLAARIAERERDDLHRALALSAYLEREYLYREQVEAPPREADGVDYFLFDMDGAYCDYFASALAVMARLNGIPSRVVTGFRSSEEDPQTAWWVVREKHAHSWVEVFIQGYGWFELDPSPIAGTAPTRIERIQEGYKAAVASLKHTAMAILGPSALLPGWWWWLAGDLAGLALAAWGIRYLRRDKVPPVPQGPGGQFRGYVRGCYERMCRWLAAWGLPKAPGATATEYSATLRQALGAQAGPMREIIAAYLAAEYGGRAVEVTIAGKVAEHLEAVLSMRKALLRRAVSVGAQSP